MAFKPVLSHADGRVVTQDSPVEWGETVVLYGIGFGAFNDTSGTLAAGFPADGHPAPTDRLVHLFTEFTDVMQVTSEVGGLPVGERYVNPDFVGLAPSWVGLAQINFQVSCLLSNAREPRVFLESLNQTRTQAFTITMSEAAKPGGVDGTAGRGIGRRNELGWSTASPEASMSWEAILEANEVAQYGQGKTGVHFLPLDIRVAQVRSGPTASFGFRA